VVVADCLLLSQVSRTLYCRGLVCSGTVAAAIR
jgi:hypothetical protein